MRKTLCFLVLFTFTISLPAQAPSTIRSSSTEVMFDLVVRDKKHRMIRDLKPDEIQVLEDGVPQKIRHFEFIDGSVVQPAAPAPVAAAAAPQPESAAQAAPPPPTNPVREAAVVSIVVGPLTEDGRKDALEALLRFVKDELQPNTYIGVYGFWAGQLIQIQPYTGNEEKLTAAVTRAVKESGVIIQTDMDFTGDNITSGGQPPPDWIANQADNGAEPISPEAPTASAGGAAGAAGAAAAGAAQAIQDNVDSLLHNLTAESAEDYTVSAQQLLSILHLVQAQRNLPGRKVVLLCLPGMKVHPEAKDFFYSAISAANRSDVTIYGWDSLDTKVSDLAEANANLARATRAIRRQALDPSHAANPTNTSAFETAERAVNMNERGQLTTMVEATGGTMLANGKDLTSQLGRIMEDVRSHYELTYAPANTAVDGTFRKIEVKVARPNVKVFARTGYYALPLIDGREAYPYELPALAALNTRPLPSQFDFQAAALRFRPGRQDTRYAFAFEAPIRGLTVTKDKAWASVHVSVTALVKDDTGRVAEKIARDVAYRVPVAKLADLQRGAVSFTQPFALPSGRYTLETAAVDRPSGKVSVRRSVLMVPTSRSGLAASDLTVVRRLSAIAGPRNSSDPLETRGGRIQPEISDTVTLAPGDSMSFYAVAYPPAPAKGPVKMSLVLARDGVPMLDSEGTALEPEPNGAASVLASLPAEKVKPGNYEARLTFTYGGQSATSETEVTVEAASAMSK